MLQTVQTNETTDRIRNELIGSGGVRDERILIEGLRTEKVVVR